MRLSLVATLTLEMIVASGCGTAKPPHAIREGTVVADLSLTLEYHDGTGVDEYYALGRDGVFGFGGGMDARFERTSWTTTLEVVEMNSLRDAIMRERWLEDELRSTNQPRETRYTISVKCDGRSVSARVRGRNERIEPVRDVLKDIANRRLQEDLDRQPRPSAETGLPATQPQS